MRYKGLIKLLMGNGSAQLISLLFLPILTRYISPESFGAYALYLASSFLFSAVVTLKYDYLITLKRNDEERSAVYFTALKFITVLSVISSIIFLAIGFNGFFLVGGFLLSVFNLNNGYFYSLKSYGTVSCLRVLYSFLNVALPLIFLSFSGYELIVANITSLSITLLFSFYFLNKKVSLLKGIDTQLLLLDKKFIRYTYIESLFQVASSQYVVIAMSTLMEKAILGFYSVANKVLLAPITLFSTAFTSFLASNLTDDKNNQKVLINGVLNLITPISIIIIFPLYFYIDRLVPLILGDAWVQSIDIFKLIMPAILAQFVFSPFYSLLHYNSLNRVSFYLNLSLLATKFSVLFLWWKYSLDYKFGLYLLFSSHAVFYFILAFYVYKKVLLSRYISIEILSFLSVLMAFLVLIYFNFNEVI